MRFNNQGFTLINAIVGIAITAILSMVMATMFSNFGKFQASLEDKVDLLTMKQGLSQEIDCRKTLLAISPTSDCNTTNYISLRNASNGTIGAAVGTGNFAGARRLGEWYLRATCDLTTRTFDVRAAKPGGSSTSFATDAVSKDAYDWSNSRGHLFGVNNTICSAAINSAIDGTLDDNGGGSGTGLGGTGSGGTDPGTVSASGGTTSAGTGSSSGSSTSSGSSSAYYVSGNMTAKGTACQTGLNKDDDGNAINNDNVFYGKVVCPAGKTPTGGGADCSAGGSAGSTLSSAPTPDSGWEVSCCIRKGSGYSGAGKLRVICQ